MLRERGAEDILGQSLPSMIVVALDLDLIMNIETGVFPGEELADQFPADLLVPEQHLKDLVADKVLGDGRQETLFPLWLSWVSPAGLLNIMYLTSLVKTKDRQECKSRVCNVL